MDQKGSDYSVDPVFFFSILHLNLIRKLEEMTKKPRLKYIYKSMSFISYPEPKPKSDPNLNPNFVFSLFLSIDTSSILKQSQIFLQSLINLFFLSQIDQPIVFFNPLCLIWNQISSYTYEIHKT